MRIIQGLGILDMGTNRFSSRMCELKLQSVQQGADRVGQNQELRFHLLAKRSALAARRFSDFVVLFPIWGRNLNLYRL